MLQTLLDGRRLVIVSNRVPTGGRGGASGGLVAALGSGLEATRRLEAVAPPLLASVGAPASRGSAAVATLEPAVLWFGWSGETGPGGSLHRDHSSDHGGNIELVTIDLTLDEVRGHYAGFCNQTLWPVFHGLTHRAHGRASDYGVWRAVNRRFADAIEPQLRDDDVIWVHDYHLIPLGAELRARGWTGTLGYFHHVPIPTPEGWAQLPAAEGIAALFASYDLVGVQTAGDATRLAEITSASAPAIAAHPVSIDPEFVRNEAEQSLGAGLGASDDDRRVVLGVDRLDYTKGIPFRLASFERLLEEHPRWRQEARMVQWAAPSRTTIAEYQHEREAVERAAAHVNRRFPDMHPVDLECSPHPFEEVAAALRDADVCLVTSVADGMNLVAKEFVAAQPPEDPGVLILSDTCGAAQELDAALLVPATNIAATERALHRALTMPLEERSTRWDAMRRTIESHTARDWVNDYLYNLLRHASGSALADSSGRTPARVA